MSWRRSAAQSTSSAAQQEETPPPTCQHPNNKTYHWRHTLSDSDTLSCLSAVGLSCCGNLLAPSSVPVSSPPAVTEHRKTRSGGGVSRNSSTSCIGTNKSPPPQCQCWQDVSRLLLWRESPGSVFLSDGGGWRASQGVEALPPLPLLVLEMSSSSGGGGSSGRG